MRLKDLIGPVTRVKKKKYRYDEKSGAQHSRGPRPDVCVCVCVCVSVCVRERGLPAGSEVMGAALAGPEAGPFREERDVHLDVHVVPASRVVLSAGG